MKSATVEGEAMLRRAQDLIAKLPSRPELRKDEIDFQIALMNALFLTKGWSSAPAREATERARFLMERAESLGDMLENPLALFAILYGIYINYRVGFDGAQILALGQEFLSLAELSNNFAASAYGRTLLGAAQVETGEIEAGRALLQRAIDELKALDRNIFIYTFNLDILSYIHIPLSYASYVLGYQDACARELKYSVNSARESNHLTTLLPNIICCTPMYVLLGWGQEIATEGNEVVQFAIQFDLDQFIQVRYQTDAFICAANGEFSKVPELLRLALEHRHSFGSTMADSFWFTLLAEAHARVGEFDAARASLREAFRHIDQKRERWFEADVHRVAGEIARQSHERDDVEVEACFERALAIARSQKARSLELRAATSFARMRRDQGRQAEARDMLVPIYSWFTEGFDKPDLKAAWALLDEL